MSAPDFGRSVNPISIKGGRSCPPNNTGTPGFSDFPTALHKYLLSITFQFDELCIFLESLQYYEAQFALVKLSTFHIIILLEVYEWMFMTLNFCFSEIFFERFFIFNILKFYVVSFVYVFWQVLNNQSYWSDMCFFNITLAFLQNNRRNISVLQKNSADAQKHQSIRLFM